MKKLYLSSGKSLFRHTLPVVVAALSLAGAKASYAVDIHVSHSGTDHTAAIQAALNNSAYSRVILDYYSTGWTTGPLVMNTPNQELWIKGSGSTPGKLVAKSGYPNFSGTSDCLIKVMDPGCTINGYSNGVDKTAGIATLEMYKNSYIAANGYTPAEWRHTVRTAYDNTTIKGVLMKNPGGDGIYINGGSGSSVKDVIVDGANRNGISVIKADTLNIRDSTFKNSYGTAATGTAAGPHAGIDFEPNLVTDSLTAITLNNNIFSSNAGDNILVATGNLSGPGVGSTMDIWFYNTTSDHAGKYGINIAGMAADGPTLGRVYFQDSDISYSGSAGIRVRQWVADHTRVTFNRFDMTHCADANPQAPIYLEDGSPVSDTMGDVLFQNGCYVDDYNSAHQNIVRGTSYGATNWKDLTGQIFYRRNYTVSTPVMVLTGSSHTETNVTVALTPY
jgi:hypothetical protein